MTSGTVNDPRVSATVGDLVTQNPARAAVFDRHQLDYCCGGGVPLGTACDKHGIDLTIILSELDRIDETATDNQIDWSQTSATALADHIEQTHHAWLREELPRLRGVVEKVARVHGESQPHLHDVAKVYTQLAENLMEHQAREERILFPAIRALEDGRSPETLPDGTIDALLNLMTDEHHQAGSALNQLRELTNSYAPPAGACTTYCVMLDSLHRLERDTHVHVHKEESILFPKARKLMHPT